MRPLLIALALFATQMDAATVKEITYAGPKGPVPAFLVTPSVAASAPARRAAIVFMHWGLGDKHAFLDEAKQLASYGVTSLLIDAPFMRPNGPKDENEDLLQAVAEVRAGVDLLAKRKEVDAKRIGFVGLSYGAHVGALLASMEPRIKALVLAGGLASNADAQNDPSLKEYDAEKWIAKPHSSHVFLQFTLKDEYISREQADRFTKAASDPSIRKWYEGNHAFNASSRADRIAWLASHLGFTIPDETYSAVSSKPARADIALFGVVFEMPGMQHVKVKRDVEFKPGMKADIYYPFGLEAKDRIPAIIAVNGQTGNADFQKAMRGVRFATTFAQALTTRANRIVVVPDIRLASAGDPAEDLRDLKTYLNAHADELQIDATQFGVITRSAGYSYGLRAAEGAKAVVVWYGNLTDAPVVKDVPALVVTAQHDFWYDAAATKKYVDASGAKQIHLPDADHGFEIFNDLDQVRDVFLETALFLRKNLPIKR